TLAYKEAFPEAEVWGVDLVEWMIKLGAGEWELPQLQPSGNAVQSRIYAEDPNKNFQPSTGLITKFTAPADVRCDTWVETGSEVSSFYDPMIAKVITFADSRETAVADLINALGEFECHGIETNAAYVEQILASSVFGEGKITTRFLNTFDYAPNTIDVLDPGLETTVQDFPGRIGMWDVGVPPSGPFDSLNFQFANQILGNNESAAGLEMSVRGGKFRFNTATTICLTGADMQAKLDGVAVEHYTAISAAAGSTLKLGAIDGPGQRAYLAVAGGFDVPEYLGSRSTFRLGRFGGHGGRALQPGDVLHLADPSQQVKTDKAIHPTELTDHWEVRVVYGPHGAPEFFTDKDIDTFFSTDWEIHYNSDRTGVRLIGPKPEWARRDGGEAGLHPSNIHDNAYCVGSIDFTGDMPILLGPDGPSLGGFVCPAVVARADLWKMGQMKPGDKVRFLPVSLKDAENLPSADCSPLTKLESPILDSIDDRKVVFRQSGDGVILVEFGDLVLDLDLRFRAQALHDWIEVNPFEGLLELVPGIRSLQIQFDPDIISGARVLEIVETAEADLPPIESMEFPSRIVHLPLSWDDPATQLAIEKYMQIVREDAPWCPSNIEFIRRINGLDSIEDVRKIVYDASYFVMGLGDVYLGAPVATPLDPRHRLVTTKYNPARTWTPENAVGIGGAYLCIYGMEGPGGYQFVGRTLPIWNRFKTTEHFVDDKPWLLRFFDQIRWYPMDADELLEKRRQFLTGEFDIEIEETTFRVADYHEFLNNNADSIADFRSTQRKAFQEERERWEASGAMSFEVVEPDMELERGAEIDIPEGCEAVTSPVSGSVWKVETAANEEVEEDQTLLILESMKMEINVGSPEKGRVREILAEAGASVRAGQVLAIVEIA
ncbi:MAG: 5-oxoprolinase/urea amidolyase family protein, partial [Verrucomicrobiota bacterium]